MKRTVQSVQNVNLIIINAMYLQPVSFVSGGIQQSGKKKNEQGDKNSEDEGK